MSSHREREIKQERLAVLRRRSGAREILLTSHEAVSWYLDGIRTHVSLAGTPVVAVRASDEGDRIFVSSNEAERLIREELRPEDAECVQEVPWFLPPAEIAAEGLSGVREEEIAQELRQARANLLPAETQRYRMLGGDAAAAMTDTALALSPETDDREAAALLSKELMMRGIEPLVVLVGAQSRRRFRHPLPAGASLGERAMLVVCGRRGGLIANATRWVGESGPDDERILEVEAAFLRATRPGATVNEVFAAGCAGYAAAGFDAYEWQRHHQGGPTGYVGRDPRATAETDDRIVENQAFAWNPTAADAKVEDTVLLTSAGFDVLTQDPRWPTVKHDGLRRPSVLSWEAISHMRDETLSLVG